MVQSELVNQREGSGLASGRKNMSPSSVCSYSLAIAVGFGVRHINLGGLKFSYL